MENKWSINISESLKPLQGFSVSVDNNGKYVGAIKGLLRTFDEAVSHGRDIVIGRIKLADEKKKNASIAQKKFASEYLFSKIYNGIYGVGVRTDENGEPYLNVSMDTNNKYLMQLIPDKYSLPNSINVYEVKKEYGEMPVAQKTNK